MYVLIITALITFGLVMLIAVGLGLFRRRAVVEGESVRRQPGYVDKLRFDLAEAGINLTPAKFLFYNAVAAAVAGLLLVILFDWWLLGAVAVPATFFGYRWFVVGRSASRRNLMIARQSAKASRRIAAALAAGIATEMALAMVARQASPQTATVPLDDEEPIVARALWEARVQITEKRITEEAALRAVAQSIGNRHLMELVEAYLSNASLSSAKLQEAMLALADEIEWAIRLRDEAHTWLSQPVNNYKLVGLITVGLALYMQAMVPNLAGFLRDPVGQILIVVLTGWWLLGFRLQRRKLNDRI
jgi:Flp pilus assembly protein TadB